MEQEMKIYIRNIVDGMEPVKAAHPGEWYDLRAAEDHFMKRGDVYAIPLGVAIKLPKGYEAILAPRSSTYQQFGIAMVNSIGVIDNSYCGNNDQWHFSAIALRDTLIHKGDRICQFRIFYQQPRCEIIYTDHLDDEDRGGFGSTGRN